MGSGNILGQTNIPLRFAEYKGLSTETADVIINNNVNERTIAVNVKGAGENYYTKEETDAKFVAKEEGKGLSTNDYTDEDKELLQTVDEEVKDLETQVSVYDYFYSIPDEDECQIAFLPLQDTKYLLREICAKWVPDGDSSLVDDFKYFYKTEITESNTTAITEEEGETHRYDESIFDVMNPFDITLYQTGALADIKTSRFGYDNIDLINKKVNRYCYVIPLSTLVKKMDKANPEADPRVVSSDIGWSSSNNGSINIKFTALGYLGIYCESGFMIKTSNPDDTLQFVFATSNFSIRNLKTRNPGVTNKATAVSYLESSLFDDFILVFKLQTPVREDFTGTVILNELRCDNINRRGVCNAAGWQIGIQASYLSLQDLVYSKDQVDEKFLSKEENSKAEHIVKIGNLDDSNKLEARTPAEVYAVLSGFTPAYPKYACATFIPVAQDSEPLAGDPVPFIGYTLFVNQNRGTFETPDFGYYVVSNGKTYWFNRTSVTELGASLDVLKDVIVDGSNDPAVITFPKNILPLSYYSSNTGYTYYFDYSDNMQVLDSEGYNVGTIEISDNQVIISLDGREGMEATVDDQLLSILYTGNLDVAIDLNTYNLYHSKVELMTETTYSNLVSLRNQNKLVPGMKYRITDYSGQIAAGTYLGTYVSSAGHSFDIIVTALTTNKLSEEASATLHSGDTYFSACNLNAWKLWYCLDNASNRYSWVDSTCKGVIYRMIDEFGNDCPYDFKNILFRKTVPTDYPNQGTYPSAQKDVYTFCRNYRNQRLEDCTVKIYGYASLYNYGCYNNKIISKNVGSTNDNQKINLPGNIFYAYNTWSDSNFNCGWFGNTLDECINCSILESGYNALTIINSSNITTLGGSGCYIINSSYVQMGSGCNNNYIEGCYSVTLGESCQCNRVFNSEQIKFENYNSYNKVETGCSSIRFGQGSNNNSIGIYCRNCLIGGNSEGNILEGNNYAVGLGFSHNTQSTVDISSGYVYNTKICSGINYLSLLGDTTGSSSAILKNITVNQGITGTITATRTASYPEPAPVTYTASGATEIII